MQVVGRIAIRGEVKIEDIDTHNNVSQQFKSYLLNGFNGTAATPQSFTVTLPQLGVTLQNPKISVSTSQSQTVSGTYIDTTFLTIKLTFINTQPLLGIINYATLYLVTNSGTVRVADTTLPLPLSVSGQFVVTWVLYFIWAEPIIITTLNVPVAGVAGTPPPAIVPPSITPNLTNITNIIATLIVPNPSNYGITPVTFSLPYITTNIPTSPINSTKIITTSFLQLLIYYVVSQPISSATATLACDGLYVLQITINQLYQYNETALIIIALGISFM